MEQDRRCWWTGKGLVAVVTGGSKGIGFELCRLLGKHGLIVVLTARKVDQGLNALDNLKRRLLEDDSEEKKEGNLHFHQLDVSDPLSISRFASWIQSTFNGLHILVNNAGIGGSPLDEKYLHQNNLTMHDVLINPTLTEPFIVKYESAKECFDTNYYGAKATTKALLPLIRHSPYGGRIINVGSSFGKLSNLRSIRLQEEMSNLNNLSEGYIDNIISNYLDDVKSGTWENKGWPMTFPNYKMSKIALHAFTRVLAKDLDLRSDGQKIYVNCVHPGYVRTEMTDNYGERTPQEGAESIVRIALMGVDECPSGQFFNEDKLDAY